MDEFIDNAIALLAYFVAIGAILIAVGLIAELFVPLRPLGMPLPGECGEPCGNGKRCTKDWWHHGEHRHE